MGNSPYVQNKPALRGPEGWRMVNYDGAQAALTGLPKREWFRAARGG